MNAPKLCPAEPVKRSRTDPAGNPVSPVRATIAPFVLNRLNCAAASQLMLSGERFDVKQGLQAGLVNMSATAEDLEALLSRQLAALLEGGPLALRETKALLRDLQPKVASLELQQQTAALIARLRGSPEGQEGLSAFLEKRPPVFKGR